MARFGPFIHLDWPFDQFSSLTNDLKINPRQNPTFRVKMTRTTVVVYSVVSMTTVVVYSVVSSVYVAG